MAEVTAIVGRRKGATYIKVIVTANDDYAIIDLLENEFYPNKGLVTGQVIRTAGSTDIVDVDIDMSFKNSLPIVPAEWTEIGGVTSVTGGASTIQWIPDKASRFLRVEVPIVGASNTLEIHLLVL